MHFYTNLTEPKNFMTFYHSPISTIIVSIKNDVFLPNRGPEGNGVISVAGECCVECD